ncbi:C4-dicarboxylate ABC transporter substrate-binding protein [Paracoccus onubensis]|uniref:C4-dicarboxylate ABC transporter substrate-binding protein n=2 Tax=Paracoccus onubensis TaxID=1675788 RepID=A0A418ST15_9RHOB|nr:C4-dicarboxylate ABC transporter substrate-binding protein [Paracoccus onubensis]
MSRKRSRNDKNRRCPQINREENNMQNRILSAAFSLMAMSGAAMAQSYSWDLANEYGESTIMGQADQVFIEAVQEASGGEMTITGHYGGSIGYKSVDQFDAVGDGALDMADTITTSLSGIEPLFLLSSLPFIANTNADAKLLWEVARPHYEELFDKHNQVLLWATPWPPSGIWAQEPITSAEEMKDLKIRGWDASGVRTLSNAGSTAVQISWADTVPQLAAGSINSVLTSADGGASSKFWEFLDDFTAVNYSMALNMTHMNKDIYDSLTPEQQDIIRAAAEKASDAAWEDLEKRVEQNFEEMRANGVTITTDVPADFLEFLRQSGQEVYDEWLSNVGPVGQQILDEYAEKRGS